MKTTTTNRLRPWRWGKTTADGKLVLELVPIRNSGSVTGAGLNQKALVSGGTYQNDATAMQDPMRRVQVVGIALPMLVVEDRENVRHEMQAEKLLADYRLVWAPTKESQPYPSADLYKQKEEK